MRATSDAPNESPAIAKVEAAATAARAAAPALVALSGGARAALLRDLAHELEDMSVRTAIAAANQDDLDRAAREAIEPARRDRLGLGPSKLDGLCDGLRQLAAAPERVGACTLRRALDDGLILSRERCPLGALGVVFEARPDAVIQIAGLAIKSGNALLLKGGSEALASNRALCAVVHRVLARHGLAPALVALLERRDDFAALLGLTGLVDLIVARGSGPFVHQVMASTKIPVMGHAEGLCHVVVDAAAEPAMAARVVVDSKCSYPAACNSLETLLWVPGAEAALDACIAALGERGVELRGCPATRVRHPAMIAATEDDWSTEYGALILAVRRVDDLAAALAHIAAFGSKHTEAIITADVGAAERFLAAVDAASVFHNASTRFADGYRYGLGAEVGISTQKLHARGPVGVDGLMTDRWLLRGHGEVAGDYGPGKRGFLHRDLERDE